MLPLSYTPISAPIRVPIPDLLSILSSNQSTLPAQYTDLRNGRLRPQACALNHFNISVSLMQQASQSGMSVPISCLEVWRSRHAAGLVCAM